MVVLEARDRIGGRIWTHHLSDGTAVDRGGGWLAPGHDVMHGLARQMGVSTYKTWVKGAHLLIGDGRTRRYTGLIPKISPLAIATLALANAKLDRLAKQLPVEAPWEAKHAQEWDARTIAWWLERSRIRTTIARDLFESAVRGLFTGPLGDTSFLHFLFLIRSAGKIETLFSIEGGYQENLVDGGAGTMASRMADELGDAIRLSSPVRSITQGDDRVVVVADGLEASVKSVIVTVPPALVLDIAFDPPLPDDRQRLYRFTVAGPESKTIVVYDEPFWRDDGFSGQSAEPKSVSEVTLDASPMSGTPGVIASFTFGAVAERVDALDASERRGLVLDALAARFGPRAAKPREFIETVWWEEEWTRGCSMAHFPPGVLTSYGPLLREPFGRIHWAGTKTATISHGAMDGAARSGERAAAEILDLS